MNMCKPSSKSLATLEDRYTEPQPVAGANPSDLVTVDVLLVAKLQQPSALAILQYTPPVTLFTGVLVNLLAVLLVPGVIVLITATALAAVRGDFSKALSAIIGAVLLYAAGAILLDRSVLVDPFLMVIFAMVGLCLILLFYIIGRTRSWSIDGGPAALLVVVIGLAALGLMLGRDEVRVAISRPYLPAERLELSDTADASGPTLIGYVLDSSDDGHWTTILREDTREIVLIRSDSIASRLVCRPAGITNPTPWWSIVDIPTAETVPPCD